MDYRIYKEGRNNEKKPKMEKKVFLNLSKNMKMKIKQKDIIFLYEKIYSIKQYFWQQSKKNEIKEDFEKPRDIGPGS